MHEESNTKRDCNSYLLTSLSGDISIWDLSSPHLPVCILQGHKDVCTGFAWVKLNFSAVSNLAHEYIIHD